MIEPHWVEFHDGEGNSYPFLVSQHGADEHMGGMVLCVDDPPVNDAGLSQGWNPRVHIGKGGPDAGASWSPRSEEEGDE